ncbi:hypothetical protein NQ318_001765 [Aromia moschata]|uniref:Uncharacterized protein n=1 Tax=Aromia moschata TaxID=1265417 RepID=A0AAV8X9E2_9CUCU|nr:hypothetical protein NQ318_001765 [Aromia moschata]
MFTKSTFTLHGHGNRQNCRYWSRENPHWMRERHTQNPEKVNVWAGIIVEYIIGHFFIGGNLNGETYLALLQNNVVPTMANLYPVEENPQLSDNAIWFHQNDVPVDDPSLSIEKELLEIGYTIKGNCSSPPSYPLQTLRGT